MLDTGKIAMTPAVELSYLKPKEQELLLETIGSEQATPSLSQAQRMKNAPSGRRSERGHHALHYVRAEKARTEQQHHPVRGKASKAFPQVLHSGTNRKHHMQAAGFLAAKAPERSEQIINQPDENSLALIVLGGNYE